MLDAPDVPGALEAPGSSNVSERLEQLDILKASDASDALNAQDAQDDAFEPRGVGESQNWPNGSRKLKKERTGGEQRAHAHFSTDNAANAAPAAELRRKSLERQLQTQLAQLDRICAERLRPSPAVPTRRRQNSNFDDFQPQPSEAGANCANASDTVGDIGNFPFSGGPASAQPENAQNTKLRQRTQ